MSVHLQLGGGTTTSRHTKTEKKVAVRGKQLSWAPTGITDLSRAKARSFWQRLMLLFHSGSQGEASGTSEN